MGERLSPDASARRRRPEAPDSPRPGLDPSRSARARERADSLGAVKRFLVGTAGHIDHGKTALVKALTGIDADRLPEEKRRGITIDLGFAHAEWEGVRVSFVDVPGHERFVRNMLGGRGRDRRGAARRRGGRVRHAADARALRDRADARAPPRASIAVTKIDRVAPELVEVTVSDVRDLLAGSLLEAAPIVPGLVA